MVRTQLYARIQDLISNGNLTCSDAVAGSGFTAYFIRHVAQSQLCNMWRDMQCSYTYTHKCTQLDIGGCGIKACQMPHCVEEDKAGPSLQFYLSTLFCQLYLATPFAHTLRAHTLFVLIPPHYATLYHMLHHFMLSSTAFLCRAPNSESQPARRLHNGDESGTLHIILSGRVAIFFFFLSFFFISNRNLCGYHPGIEAQAIRYGED